MTQLTHHSRRRLADEGAVVFALALLAHADIAILGLGPRHAVSIRFLASISIALVTRVTCGHSGRMLAVDKVTWSLFLAFQLTAVSRIAAEAFPSHYTGFAVLSSAIWFTCFGVWVWRSAPIYLAPRQDRLPG